MRISITNLVEIEICGWKSNVGLRVDPNRKRVPVGDEDPLPDVKLAALHNQRILDILLADVQLTFTLVANQLIAVFELDQV